MIPLAITPDGIKNTAADVIGPYSAWPQRKSPRFMRPAVYAGSVGLLGVFFHCVAPLIA